MFTGGYLLRTRTLRFSEITAAPVAAASLGQVVPTDFFVDLLPSGKRLQFAMENPLT